MDVNDIRIAVTVLLLVAFVVLVVRTWSRRRQAEHQEAALLPFVGDDEGVQGEPR